MLFFFNINRTRKMADIKKKFQTHTRTRFRLGASIPRPSPTHPAGTRVRPQTGQIRRSIFPQSSRLLTALLPISHPRTHTARDRGFEGRREGGVRDHGQAPAPLLRRAEDGALGVGHLHLHALPPLPLPALRHPPVSALGSSRGSRSGAILSRAPSCHVRLHF